MQSRSHLPSPERLRYLRPSGGNGVVGVVKKPKAVKLVVAPTVTEFSHALEAAGVKPHDTAETGDKRSYSQRLSESFAVLVAHKLRATGSFPDVLPNADGTGRESRSASGAHKRFKKTDVRYSTRDSGLELLVSIKTLNFRNSKKVAGEIVVTRYTKNMVRNDHELRAEAMEHHERFPYAVLVALFLIPADSCDDGTHDVSSFAHAILTFRHRGGRMYPTDPDQLFERFFIGLYEPSGPRQGEIGFYDVLTPRPPRRGRPNRLLTLDQTMAEVIKSYGIRNSRYVEWADEGDMPVLEAPPEDEEPDTDAEPEE